jgi:hypothetical protein
MAELRPQPKWHERKNDGTPYAGGKLFFYDVGTTTKKDTYKDSAQTATNTNPVILDSNGQADIWLDGSYKVVFAPDTDSDPPVAPIYTKDNYVSPNTVITPPSINLIEDGSFELDDDSDGVPDKWSITLFTGGVQALDTTDQNHGARSLKFTSVGTGGGTAESAYFECSPDVPIDIAFDIKSSVADVLNIVQFDWYTSTKVLISSTTVYSDSATNPTSWTRKSYINNTPVSTARYCKIKLTGCDSSDTTTGSTWFDNILVQLAQNVDTGTTSTTFAINSDGNKSTLTTSALTANRTHTLPNASGTVTLDDGASTLTNKTIDGNNNTLTVLASSQLSGAVPIANGGSGQTTAQAAIDALTGASSATDEYVLTKDTSTGNAIFKALPASGLSASAFPGLKIPGLYKYSSTTAITLDPSVVEVNDGGTSKLLYWDSTLTFTFGPAGSNGASSLLGSKGWQYLYVHATLSGDSPVTASDLLNYSIAPTYSASKHGWYYGANWCCIAAFRTNSSSQIEKFIDLGDGWIQPHGWQAGTGFDHFLNGGGATSYTLLSPDVPIGTTAIQIIAQHSVAYTLYLSTDGVTDDLYVGGSGSDSHVFRTGLSTARTIYYKMGAGNMNLYTSAYRTNY